MTRCTRRPCSSVSYSRDESSRARELLASVTQLQPLVFGLAEELLSVSLELNAARLQQVLDSLTQQVRREEEKRRRTFFSGDRNVTGLVSSSFPSFPQTKLFVHALKDELVKGALLAIHNQRSVNGSSSHIHSNGLPPDNTPANQEGQASPWQQDSERDADYNEEEWASWSFSRIMFMMVVHLF